MSKESVTEKEIDNFHLMVESEVKKCLKWRVVLIMLTPVPMLLLLVYFLHCYVHLLESKAEGQYKYIKTLENRLNSIERRLQ